jgi:mannose-1-phosphate guanylyltransferase/mannose-6-phosphate isomerase
MFSQANETTGPQVGLYPVLLCGGTGERLWPLSRRDTPKQFLIWKDGKSLFRETFERAKNLPRCKKVVCVGRISHSVLIKQTVGEETGRELLILESTPRNTAASIGCAALLIEEFDPKAILICLPTDHVISPIESFQTALAEAAAVAKAGWITVLGVVPTAASASFGYILPSDARIEQGRARCVQHFAEKPDLETASEYVRKGYLLNSGIVAARSDVLITALERHASQILSSCRTALARAHREQGEIRLDSEAFLSCEHLSFDYAVLEREEHLAVVDYAGDWCDVGSWPEFAKFYSPNEQGNRLVGSVVEKSCTDTVVVSRERLAVVLGLRSSIVVDTPDALLVAQQSELAQIANVLGELGLAQYEQVGSQKVIRPWGHYESIARAPGYQVKKIAVKPAASLSLQYHKCRSEHWVVVKGVAVVTCEDRRFELRANESTYIALGAVHRLENQGSEMLELIEVQLGDYLEEDDIVRLEDNYGRA